MSVLVIAEIGSAWRFGWELRGDHILNAKHAIDLAKDCGADCIKFQWCSDPRMMERRRNVPEGSYDILAWPQEWIPELAAHAKEIGIEWMCTVFLPEDVAVLNPFVKRWKVASLECKDHDLLRTMHKTLKPLIVSYGADDGETTRMLETHNLHCTAAYPASIETLNLNVLRGSAYDGYSDHSCDELTGALAVACGAEIIEVHFRLDDTPEDNPDYMHSHPPIGLRRYIANIRKAEVMLGDGIKKIMPCEEWALKHKVKA